MHVGLDDDFERFALRRGERGKKIFERNLAVFLTFSPGLKLTLLGQFARGLFVLDDAEFQTRLRHAIQAEHFDRDGRSGFLEPLAFFVNQGAHFAVKFAAQGHIADVQCAFAHEHRRSRAAGFHAGFDDVALGPAIRIGLQLQQIGLEQNHFQQFVYALFCLRGNIHKNCFTAPIIRHKTLVL